MNFDVPQLLGLGVMAITAGIVSGLVLWNQARAIKWCAVALILVGLGYLSTTPAPTRLARVIFGEPG